LVSIKELYYDAQPTKSQVKPVFNPYPANIENMVSS